MNPNGYQKGRYQIGPDEELQIKGELGLIQVLSLKNWKNINALAQVQEVRMKKKERCWDLDVLTWDVLAEMTTSLEICIFREGIWEVKARDIDLGLTE